MPTVAEIAAEAFSAVAADIPDAIHPATLTRTTQGAYNPATGSYSTTTTTQTGRAVVDTTTPAADIFPGFVVGPADQLVLIEGTTSVRENDKLAFAGRNLTVLRAQDIAAAGALHYVLAR